MECNEDEGIRALRLAESKIESKNYAVAKKLAEKARKLAPSLTGIHDLIAVAETLLAGEDVVGTGSSDAELETNWYTILNVSTGSNTSEIKQQYRKLALSLHPDKNKAVGSEEAFKLISKAHSILSNESLRQEFDQKIQQQRNVFHDHRGAADQQPPGSFQNQPHSEFHKFMMAMKKHERNARVFPESSASWEEVGKNLSHNLNVSQTAETSTKMTKNPPEFCPDSNHRRNPFSPNFTNAPSDNQQQNRAGENGTFRSKVEQPFPPPRRNNGSPPFHQSELGLPPKAMNSGQSEDPKLFARTREEVTSSFMQAKARYSSETESGKAPPNSAFAAFSKLAENPFASAGRCIGPENRPFSFPGPSQLPGNGTAFEFTAGGGTRLKSAAVSSGGRFEGGSGLGLTRESSEVKIVYDAEAKPTRKHFGFFDSLFFNPFATVSLEKGKRKQGRQGEFLPRKSRAADSHGMQWKGSFVPEKGQIWAVFRQSEGAHVSGFDLALILAGGGWKVDFEFVILALVAGFKNVFQVDKERHPVRVDFFARDRFFSHFVLSKACDGTEGARIEKGFFMVDLAQYERRLG